jgi:hypothetical protein
MSDAMSEQLRVRQHGHIQVSDKCNDLESVPRRSIDSEILLSAALDSLSRADRARAEAL